MSLHPSADPEIISAIETFSRDVLLPRARDIDEGSIFTICHRDALSEIGLFGLNLPSLYGGAGVNAHTLFESIARMTGACASTASMVTAHYLGTDSILHGGSESQKAQYLPRAAKGELLCAFALTEPNAGSNPADMTSLATRDGAAYRLKGVKHFISNAGAADLIVVYAKTDPAQGARGISAFLVDPRSEGIMIGPAEKTMGLKGGHVFEIQFDCVIAEERRLGAEGSGFRTALKALDAGRLDIAAACVGIADEALAHSVQWTKTRIVGGSPLADYQGLQWMLADMATQLEAARALGHQAAALRAAGERYSHPASMAKLFASEMAAHVTDKALQIHGGYGYTRGFPLERFVRDARIMRIYEGSSEIQRNIIARTLLA